MPIKALPGGGYEVSVCVNYRRIHRRLPQGSTSRDAKRLEADLISAIGKQRDVVIPGDPSMTAIMALYVEAAAHLRSPSTAIHHAQRIGQWCEKYRASQAKQCAAHIIKDMMGKYAVATINRSLGTMKRGLQIAFDNDRTPDNYALLIKCLPENNQRDVYLSMDQVKAIADLASPNTKAAIWIALLTGCRRGEVCKIKADHIGEDVILIPAGNTKKLRTRSVPIVPALRPWLKFLPLKINYEGVKSGFRRAREAADMPHVHFHDLRHSCATILLSLEVPLDVVRDILGHSTIKSTERYAHAIVNRQRDALGKLGDAMDKAFK